MNADSEKLIRFAFTSDSPVKLHTVPDFGFLDSPQETGELGHLGRYRILALIGRGGMDMGMVFRAYDPMLDRYVDI